MRRGLTYLFLLFSAVSFAQRSGNRDSLSRAGIRDSIIHGLPVRDSVLQPILTLPDAINIALEKSLDIHLARNTVRSNAVVDTYGNAGGMPIVVGNLGDNNQLTTLNQEYSDPTRNTSRANAFSNTLTAGISGSLLLFNGMRVVATKTRLDQLVTQSQQLLNFQIQYIIANVMTKYYDIVRQQSYSRTLQQSVEVSQQRLTIVKAQREVGLANNQDLFQSELDLNQLLQNLKAQDLVVAQDKTDLLTLLTLKADSTVFIGDTILIDRSIMLDSVLNAIGRNGDVQAAEEQIRINQQIVRETAAQRYPSITLNGGLNLNRSQNAAGFSLLNQSYGPYIGFGVTVPIFNGFAYRNQQRAAEINVNSAKVSRDIKIRDYSSTVVKNYQTYLNSIQQLETQKESYRIGRQLVDLVLEKYRLHQATIIDVRVAQQSFEQAGYQLANLNYAAKAAEIELRRVSAALSF